MASNFGTFTIKIEAESFDKAVKEMSYLTERIRSIFPSASNAQHEELSEVLLEFLSAHTKLE